MCIDIYIHLYVYRYIHMHVHMCMITSLLVLLYMCVGECLFIWLFEICPSPGAHMNVCRGKSGNL